MPLLWWLFPTNLFLLHLSAFVSSSHRQAEVEFSRTSLASRTSSRTHFEVLGLGLEASSPQKLACPRLEDSTIFELLKFWEALENFYGKHFFVKIAWKIFVKTFFFFFVWRALVLVSLVLGLGLEHSCPWPRECLSSERLSLALASDFSCVFGLCLEPCVLDSTSADRGAEGGWEIYFPNNLSIVCICISPIIWLWCAFERRSPLELGEQSFPSFNEDLFFGLHLICSPEKKIVVEVHPPQSWK